MFQRFSHFFQRFPWIFPGFPQFFHDLLRQDIPGPTAHRRDAGHELRAGGGLGHQLLRDCGAGPDAAPGAEKNIGIFRWGFRWGFWLEHFWDFDWDVFMDFRWGFVQWGFPIYIMGISWTFLMVIYRLGFRWWFWWGFRWWFYDWDFPSI